MRKIIIFIFISVFLLSCVPEPLGDSSGGKVLGELGVDLDLRSDFLRKEEAPVGNLIADSILYSLNNNETLKSELKSSFSNNNLKVDLVVINAGAIRYSRSLHPDGIMSAGDFTTGMLDEIQPFTNIIYVIQVTGAKLKEIFEHSVADIDNSQGQFLQVSRGVVVTVDKSKKAEILKINADGSQEILEAGKRVLKIEINGMEVDELTNYYIVVSDYVSTGGDNFLSFSSITDDLKFNTKETFKEAIIEYVTDKGVVEPSVEGRVVYVK